jgi:hypothetical protein
MNILDDLLNVLKKPAQPSQTVSGTAKVDVGHTTPSPTAGAGMTGDVQKQKAADQLKLKGGPWPLLRAAGWGHLTEKRGDLYKGPFIDDIAALTPEVKAALKTILGL